MAVTLFAGLIGGAILGFATQNGRSRLCEFVRVRHPILFRTVGLSLLIGAALLPTLALTEALSINLTPFFWGGCLAFNFIIGFFVIRCEVAQQWRSG